MSHQVRMTETHMLADYDRQTIVNASAWGASSNRTFDLASVDPANPVMNVVITGTLASGIHIQKPINMPKSAILTYLFVNPGDNTPTFDGYTVFSVLPQHVSGKSVLYQVKRLSQDSNPANDLYLLTGEVQDPTGVSGGGGGHPYSVGAVGVEQIVGTYGGANVYRKRFAGNLGSGGIHVIGGPTSGTADIIVGSGGGVELSNQAFPIPYNGTNPTTQAISIQRHTTNQFRLIVGSNYETSSASYDLFVDYTKV